MSKPDGGPAFPKLISGHDAPSRIAGHRELGFASAGGMTLRDYLAGQADIPWNAVHETLDLAGHGPKHSIETITKCRARLKYMEADAMLQERDK